MKLKDKGTILDPTAIKKSLQGKEYLVLRVTYEENIGEDTWYFYLIRKPMLWRRISSFMRKTKMTESTFC
ncbi:DUF6503 family protein [Muriicola soli]|uniref:DUF6503 family protein n=1 Tax=Muriicola soli TaxID=2507538 RepID=UPI002482E5B2|nr:DUF6503 family protein [Muriicola soli]